MKTLLKPLTLASSLLLVACGESGYPDDVTQASIETCKESGATFEMCRCVSEHIQSAVTYKEMQRIEETLADGGTPPPSFVTATTNAAKACAKL